MSHRKSPSAPPDEQKETSKIKHHPRNRVPPFNKKFSPLVYFPFLASLRYLVFGALDLEGVPEVDGKVGDEKEHDDVPARLSLLVGVGVAAPPKAVDDH